MITHYIIMSSSYSLGKRIAIDFPIAKEEYDSKVKEVVSYIVKECGKDVSLSTHLIQAESSEWKEIVEKDYFFKDVQLISSIDEFINLIKKDRELIGLDVAKYILCKYKCTHLKLEKLVYMCFAEYLCDYQKELFIDKIYAYKYGPVVKSVYEKYKKYGYKDIDEENVEANDVYELPSKSRILFAEDGINKLKSIEKTLIKYGNCTAGELVDITHRKDTPWEKTGKGLFFDRIIKNDIILKYHLNEI